MPPDLQIPPAVWVLAIILGSGIVAYAVVQYFRVVHPSILETHKTQMAAQAAGFEKQLAAQGAAASAQIGVMDALLRDEIAHCRAERARDAVVMAAERDKDREFRHQQAQLMQTALGGVTMAVDELRGLIERMGTKC